MKRFLLLLKSYLPTPLPVGMTAFNKWAQEVITITGPIADEKSLKYAIASQIIHLDHKKSNMPMQYFVRCLRKAAANQVASQVFQDIKREQEEAAKASLTPTPDDTGSTASSNEQSKVL